MSNRRSAPSTCSVCAARAHPAQHHRRVPLREPTQHRDGSGAEYDGPVTDTLRVERTGPGDAIAQVTLAKPDHHNAFDASLIAELRAAFGGLGREEPTALRVIVLAGDGPTFCAGADLAWMRAALTLDTEANEQDAMAMAEMFEAIDSCPVP